MTDKIPWSTLILVDLTGETLPYNVVERALLLVDLRDHGQMNGAFVQALPGQDPSRPYEWGPPRECIDWTGIDLVIGTEDAMLDRLEAILLAADHSGIVPAWYMLRLFGSPDLQKPTPLTQALQLAGATVDQLVALASFSEDPLIIELAQAQAKALRSPKNGKPRVY